MPVGRIKGHYEWDDDSLTPGQKKEGGLHQNLFDDEGKLKGSARFVPDDGSDSESLTVTETVYITVEDRRTTEEEDALRQEIVRLLALLAVRGVAVATPHVQQWWRDKARPALAARRAQFRARRSPTQALTDAAQPIADGPTAELAPSNGPRVRMSSAEAKARLLAALAAEAYSKEQLRLVASAEIVEGGSVAELQQALANLPSSQTAGVIEAMATNPSLLSDDALAQLASLLGRQALE